MSLPGTDVVHKVSIIPRGIGALGYTIQRPTEDRFLMSRGELDNKMAVLLGGRAAETVVFDEISTGAADDLAKVTDIARAMVTRFGMVEALGQIAYEDEPQRFLGNIPTPAGFDRRYSEETARKIDDAVRDLVDKAFEKAVSILKDKRAILDKAAEELLQRETLGGAELATLFGGDGPSDARRHVAAASARET
jgi:cell division protease FtsH